MIFLSYASACQAKVYALGSDLTSNGNAVWLDRFQLTCKKEDWSNEIFSTLKGGACKHFILFSSPAALQSNWVRWECATATALDIPRSIITLETCNPVHEYFGQSWDTSHTIAQFDLRSNDATIRISDWKRFITGLDSDAFLDKKTGIPQIPFTEHDWHDLWKESGLPQEMGAKGWTAYIKEPGHLKSLEELEMIISFFNQRRIDPLVTAKRTLEFITKYFASRFEYYKKWYTFCGGQTSYLSENILTTTPHAFAMRMTSLDPEPILSHFNQFKPMYSINHDYAWLHAITAVLGASYGEKYE